MNDDTVIILYEVFTGKLPEGGEIMVQVFRKKGTDKSMFSQAAFRTHSGASWGPPIRLDDRHQLVETAEDLA